MAAKHLSWNRYLSIAARWKNFANRSLRSARQVLEQADQELEREEELGRTFDTGVPALPAGDWCIDDMRMYSDFFTRKREEIKRQKERVEQLDQIMNEKRSDLMEASKEKKVLESLKVKKAA